MKMLLLLSLFLAGPTAAQVTKAAVSEPAAETVDLKLFVGVRADAPPFSYAQGHGPGLQEGRGPLGQAGYAGYIAYICDRVLESVKERSERAGTKLTIVPIPVTAADRFKMLRALPGDESPHVDILCDPATATRERVREFTASLPLYLSGIGFAAQPNDKISQAKSACHPRIGVVRSTTAFRHGLTRILEGNEWASYRENLLRYLDNPAGWRVANRCHIEFGEPVEEFETHRDLVKSFCAGGIQYYVGDQEIVNSALRMFGNCDYRPATTTYSDDRYVLFMRNPESNDPGKAQLLMTFSRTLSELVLTQPSLLEQAFQVNFVGYESRDKLSLFFWSLYGP